MLQQHHPTKGQPYVDEEPPIHEPGYGRAEQPRHREARKQQAIALQYVGDDFVRIDELTARKSSWLDRRCETVFGFYLMHMKVNGN